MPADPPTAPPPPSRVGDAIAPGGTAGRKALALVLPQAVRARIVEHARAAYPNEACGLLSGRIGPDRLWLIDQAHATDNVSASNRKDRFEVDPAAHAALSRDLRGGSTRIVGHYHSHPNHPPEPSATDKASIADPDAVWVIVGLNSADDKDPAIKAWTVREWDAETMKGQFRALAIVGQSGGGGPQSAQTDSADDAEGPAP